jgi:hypothetical protein
MEGKIPDTATIKKLLRKNICCNREKTWNKDKNCLFFLFYFPFYHSVKIESNKKNRVYENKYICTYWIKVS